MADGKPQTKEDYKELLTEVIKKQIVVLGPDVAILKARNVEGLKISEEGDVNEISGDPQKVLQKLIDQYVALSGEIVKSTVEPLLAKYPALEVPSLKPSSNNQPN